MRNMNRGELKLADVFSVEAKLLVHPHLVYRALADETAAERIASVWLPLRRPLLFLLAIGVFVSLTTAGRLIWFHVISAMAAWSFVVAYEAFWILVVTHVTSPRRRRAEVIDLFFAGQGPWLLFLSTISAICIFAPRVWPVFQFLLGSGILAGFLLATIVWSGVVTFAFFRSALALSTKTSLLAMLAFYVGFDGSIAFWYLVTGQLYSLLFSVT